MVYNQPSHQEHVYDLAVILVCGGDGSGVIGKRDAKQVTTVQGFNISKCYTTGYLDLGEILDVYNCFDKTLWHCDTKQDLFLTLTKRFKCLNLTWAHFNVIMNVHFLSVRIITLPDDTFNTNLKFIICLYSIQQLAVQLRSTSSRTVICTKQMTKLL